MTKKQSILSSAFSGVYLMRQCEEREKGRKKIRFITCMSLHLYLANILDLTHFSAALLFSQELIIKNEGNPKQRAGMG